MPYQSRARENLLAHFAPGTSRCFSPRVGVTSDTRAQALFTFLVLRDALRLVRPLCGAREKGRGGEGGERVIEWKETEMSGGGGDAHLSVRIHKHIPPWTDATHARKHARQHTTTATP
jgi:hypothetical protein